MFNGFKKNRNLSLMSAYYWIEMLKTIEEIPNDLFKTNNLLASQMDGNPLLYFYLPNYDLNIRIIQEDPENLDLDEDIELVQVWEDEDLNNTKELVISVIPVSLPDWSVEDVVSTVLSNLKEYILKTNKLND
jgi:hypothetical protein